MSLSKDYFAESNRSNVPTSRLLLLDHPFLYHDAGEAIEANAHLPHVVCRGTYYRLFGQCVLHGHSLI